MVAVQSFIRAEVSRGEFPAPKGAEVLPAYVIASNKGLIPEMENITVCLDLPRLGYSNSFKIVSMNHATRFQNRSLIHRVSVWSTCWL